MKTSFEKNYGALFALAIGCAFSGAVFADNVVTETREVTARGTVSSFEPGSFVIKSESAPAPLSYQYSKGIQYVDEAGQVITRETIRPGAPVTVHYVREGDRMVANRVVVNKTTTTTTESRTPTRKEAKALREAAEHPEREARRAAERGKPFPPEDPSLPKTITTTTVTSSDGTVSSFAPDHFVVKSATSDGPVTYRYTKTTQYVDERGAPVSMEIVKSGVPVTVNYVREGDGYIAQRVIVHGRR